MAYRGVSELWMFHSLLRAQSRHMPKGKYAATTSAIYAQFCRGNNSKMDLPDSAIGETSPIEPDNRLRFRVATPPHAQELLSFLVSRETR